MSSLLQYLASINLFNSPLRKEGLFSLRYWLILLTIFLEEISLLILNRLSARCLLAESNVFEGSNSSAMEEREVVKTSESKYLKNLSRNVVYITVRGLIELPQLVLDSS